MGVVYLAEREDLGSFAAVKILRDASLSPSRRERFASEQRTLAQLDHPSIARLYDAGTLPDGTPWFVMEYVDGLPLTAYCAMRVRSVPGRLELFRAVCEAVQHAHQHAIIHRDLKPSNILVRQDGGVKLLDFGIAKQLESLEMAADQTRTGLRLMTPAYAAPEQLSGERVGIHTDIYSLGVILYELLAGRLPFDFSNQTPAEIARTLAEQEPARPSEVAGKGSAGAVTGGSSWADLDVLCLTAMHKDPARRYRTVDALIRDVEHFLRGEPLAARPDTLGYRLGKFVRRNWRAVSVTAAGAALVIGLVIFYTVRLATARNAALAETARTQRIQGFMLDLFQGGDEVVGPAESLRVVTLVDRGVQEARIPGWRAPGPGRTVPYSRRHLPEAGTVWPGRFAAPAGTRPAPRDLRPGASRRGGEPGGVEPAPGGSGSARRGRTAGAGRSGAHPAGAAAHSSGRGPGNRSPGTRAGGTGRLSRGHRPAGGIGPAVFQPGACPRRPAHQPARAGQRPFLCRTPRRLRLDQPAGAGDQPGAVRRQRSPGRRGVEQPRLDSTGTRLLRRG